ncbi:hypothetical protein V3C99_004395, partial [Haemonchus contortus]
GSVDQALRAQVSVEWTECSDFAGILSRRCSKMLKEKVHRRVVRPTMLYDSEC